MGDFHPIDVGVSTQQSNKKKFALAFVKSLPLAILYWFLAPLPIFSLSAIVGIPISLLYLIFLLATRIIQLIKSGDEYETLVVGKDLIRIALALMLCYTLVGWWLFFLVAKYTPLKQVTVLELSLKNWMVIISKMVGLYLLSSFSNYLVALPFEVYAMHGVSRNARQAISEIFDSLVFWWATNVLMNDVPSLKHHAILGLPTQKWIKVSVLILIGYNLFIIVTRMIIGLSSTYLGLYKTGNKGWFMIKCKDNTETFFDIVMFHGKYVMYYANGMIPSTCFVMSSLVLLLTWIYYFGSQLDLKSANVASFWESGRWTFVCLLVFSILWLIKSLVLLAWEAHTVYHRLQLKIKSTSQQLYFLGILASLQHDFLRIKNTNPNTGAYLSCLLLKINKLFSKLKLVAPEVRKTVQNNLLIESNKYLTLEDIQRASKYFIVAKQHLSKETFIPHVLDNFYQSRPEKLKELILGEKVNNEQERVPENPIQIAQVSSKVNETFSTSPNNVQDSSTSNEGGKWNSDWILFSKKLEDIKKENLPSNKNQDNPNYEIGYNEFQTWVDRAHNHCMNLANTLDSAKEVADCLNKFISWLLIGAIFIMWLLVTGLATTKVFVLIASPLVAASFIFGETCKTLFQGLVYVFVVHPFYVGDLCVIEGETMEVRSIGIWSTTFKKVDQFGSAQEFEIHYSNTELMKTTIINQKTKFDWSDRVEVKMGPVDDEDNHTSMTEFFRKHLKQEENRGNQLKPDKEEELHHVTSHEGKDEEICSSLDKGKGIASEAIDDNEETECLRKNKISKLLSISPHLSVSTKEDSIILVIRLVYKAEKTEDWTHSECLRRKDELKGEFHLCMRDLIREYKAEQRKKEETTKYQQSKH